MNLALTTPASVAINIIQVNLLGTIYCCQNFAPLMLRNKTGSILNFSTIAVALGLKGESIYAASKAGVEGFTRSFAREMADFNVRVNCIAPGPIDTNLLKGITSTQIQKIVTGCYKPQLAKFWDKDLKCYRTVTAVLLHDGQVWPRVGGPGAAVYVQWVWHCFRQEKRF
jgi:NAD(P)-dependent dehydrogenase (short-subunit alcohol dehydrogenase family)